MKVNKIKIFTSIIFILFYSFTYSQNSKFNVVGIWNSIDYSKNESKTIFSEDGYVSMTINGEKIDGKNFIIHGGPNDGQKAELKYEIFLDKNPIQIDFIAIKDNEERGRILGIMIPSNNDNFILLMNFNGKRPQKIDNENEEQILKLTREE